VQQGMGWDMQRYSRGITGMAVQVHRLEQYTVVQWGAVLVWRMRTMMRAQSRSAAPSGSEGL
jgi:hypothetical protein